MTNIQREVKQIISIPTQRSFFFLEGSIGPTQISCGMYIVRRTYSEGL